MQIDVALDAREIQDTGQMERVIHVQMNPEQRFVGHRIQILIEFLIIFICHISRLTNPCRLDIVDDIVFVGIDIFAVFPFLLLSECDGNWQVTAVLSQQAVDLVFVQEIFVLVVNIQDDVCSAIFFSVSSNVYSGVPSQLHFIGTAPSLYDLVTISTFLETIKEE